MPKFSGLDLATRRCAKPRNDGCRSFGRSGRPGHRLGTGPAGDALEINVLKRLIGNEPASLHALLEDFLGVVSAGPATIKGTAVADELGEIGSVAYRLKSSPRSVGALPLGDARRTGEQLAPGGQGSRGRGPRRRRSCGQRAAAAATRAVAKAASLLALGSELECVRMGR